MVPPEWKDNPSGVHFKRKDSPLGFILNGGTGPPGCTLNRGAVPVKIFYYINMTIIVSMIPNPHPLYKRRLVILKLEKSWQTSQAYNLCRNHLISMQIKSLSPF